ncbi:MAG: GAF domain-containing protein [Anaerolineales bacterium]|nr:GAF domain-containing protein [Anaerolineales bacterium]
MAKTKAPNIAKKGKTAGKQGAALKSSVKTVKPRTGKKNALSIAKRAAALEQQNEYLALLNEVTMTILLSGDFDTILRELAKNMARLTNADDCYITLWDEERNLTIPQETTAILNTPYSEDQLPSSHSMTASVLRSGHTLTADDVFNSPYIDSEIARHYPARSVMGAPLIVRKHKLGAAIIAFNTPHHFTQEEVKRAEYAAGHIAVAVWNAQQDIEIKKRLKEQQTLARITTALSQTERIGLANLLKLIVDSSRDLIANAQQAVIHLVDQEKNFLIPKAVSGIEITEDNKSKMRIGEGVAGQVITDEQSIYIPDIQNDERYINLSANINYRSMIVAPVSSGSQKLGTISIQSRKTHAFSRNDISLLNELSQQAAIAIENARLYAAVQQELAERIYAETALRSSEERYRSVSEDIPAMICRFQADGTLTYVNQFYSQFFGKKQYEFTNINLFSLIEDEEEKAKVKSKYLSLTQENPFTIYEVNETNSRGEKRWVQWIDRMIYHKDNENVEYQAIGMDITERKLAELERERLLKAEHVQRLRAETSADATLALVSHTETDKVLNEILHQVQKLLPGCAANIALLEGDILRTAAWLGYENRGEEGFKNLIKRTSMFPVEQQVMQDPRPLLVADTHQDPNWKILPGLEWIRSNLSIPLMWNNEMLGLLYIDEDTPNKVTEETANLLKPLVNATTVALESSILIETTRQALKETSALYRINQGLVALETDELLKDAVELLKNNFDYYHVQVFVIDPVTENFILKAASGEIGKRLVEAGHELRAGAGIIGYAAETGMPFFTNNVEEVVFFMFDPYLPETKAEMAIPVRNGEKLYGILDIQQTTAKPFTPRDQQLVITVADQLAVALHKAELYKDLQTALQQEKNIRNQLVQNERLAIMGRLLASVSHELNNPLQAIQNALFLLKEEKGLSQQGLNDLDIVLAESERMAALIERLRTTYRPPQAEELQPTYINNIIEDVYALLATHLRKNEVVFEFHPQTDLPPIMALPDQIRQVALNLMINAVEAMPNGGSLTVDTHYLRASNEVKLSVSDMGAGISPAILPSIFNPFVTNKKRGTGIGLTISHDIVTKHRGRITAENNQGKPGATFNVWLPVEQPLSAEIE